MRVHFQRSPVPTDITVAVAGHGPNTQPNIEALLGDWLRLAAPDGEGYYTKPDHLGTLTFYALLADGTIPDGLKPALHMLASIDGARLELVTDNVQGDVAKWAKVADKTQEVDDPYEFVINELASAKRAHLLINWNEVDADDEELINLAHERGVRVLDLVNGLALIQRAEPEDEAEAEPEPEESEPTQTRATRKAPSRQVEELEEAPEELEDEAAPQPEKPQANPLPAPSEDPSTLEEEVSAAKRTQTTIAVGEVTVDTELLRETSHVLGKAAYFMRAIDAQNAAKNLAETQYSPLTQALMDSVQGLERVLNPEVDYDQALPAPAKPAKAQKSVLEPGRKVVWDEDEEAWKPAARGRRRAGTRVGVVGDDGNVIEQP